MTILTDLSSSTVRYDFVVVGGGTAGCVIASRLTEYLPTKTVLLLEGGPSDLGNNEVLYLQRCINLLGGDMDYDYPIAPQERGNGNIRMSRAKMLGGCSSHNDCVAMRPFEYDMRQWAKLGVKGWSFDTFSRLLGKLRTNMQVVDPRHRNELCKDWLESATTATGVPLVHDFNKALGQHGNLQGGAGWITCAYYPDDKRRSSASVNYIHPVLLGKETRPNLHILTDAWVSKLIVGAGDVVAGVNVTLKSGQKHHVLATEETVICAGAIDTPRLMLLSGIGPREDLESLSIPVVKDLPGVGKNLADHPESIVLLALNRPVPTNSTMDSDATLILRREPVNPIDGDYAADLQIHMYALPLDLNTRPLGYETPEHGFSMMPNVPRARSRGCVYLRSANPSQKPVIDFKYFTDPEGYDEATIVEGIKVCRKIAAQPPFSDWVVREVAPGPHIQTDEEISEFGRKAANTVYHPSGTAKMGDVEQDPLAVVDSELRVKGIKKLRVADASVFPVLTTLNPMLTVLCVGERAAELIASKLGWQAGMGRL